ncbi:hypothetical protein [Aquiflexum sp.]|uniref:hypothetical protein n=1 Tax=Aquiflexum sp. TaxID=1872584 RepID=UPI0035948CC0
MKKAFLILTVIYLLAFINFLYGLVLRIYVHFANKNLGHHDDFIGDITNTWHLVLSVVFFLFTFGAYKAYKSPASNPILKWFAFLPVALIVLYILWAIIILISAGGKWN